jgi:hypothetical protein
MKNAKFYDVHGLQVQILQSFFCSAIILLSIMFKCLLGLENMASQLPTFVFIGVITDRIHSLEDI